MHEAPIQATKLSYAMANFLKIILLSLKHPTTLDLLLSLNNIFLVIKYIMVFFLDLNFFYQQQ